MLFFNLRGRLFTAVDFADASGQFCAARDASTEGASTFQTPTIFDDAENVAGHFSYNGKIWAKPAHQWAAGDVPLFSPFN